MITYTVDLCCDGPNCAAMISCGPEAMVAKAIIGAERHAKHMRWKKQKGLWLCVLCQPAPHKRPVDKPKCQRCGSTELYDHYCHRK